MIQQSIYRSFILLFLINFYGCNPTTQNKNLSSNTESAEASKIVQKESPIEATPAVIYKSSDMETWSPFAKGIPNEATLSGIKQYRNKIYVTTDYNGVFVSEDGQDDWRALNEEQLKGLDINCIDVEGNNLIIGTLNEGVLVSKDDGLSWNPSGKNINSAIRAFVRYKGKLYAGTDSGVFESVDGGESWSHSFGQLQVLGFTLLNEKVYAATQSGVLLYDGDSADWKSIYNGDALHDVGNDGQYIYAMTIGQQLLKTQNDGKTWENAQNGITYPTNFYTNELQHIGNDVFSAQWIGIYHSENNGNNWRKMNGLPDSAAFSTLEITDFGIIAGISIR